MSNQFGNLNLLDMDTDIVSAFDMPEETALVAMTACGGKFILAGGGYPYDNTDLVQIYDPASDTWTSSSLSESKANLRGACRNGMAYFAGGETDVAEYTTKVEIYDVSNETWAINSIPVGRDELTVKATENAVYIGGGHNLSLDDDYPTDVSIFTSPTNAQVVELPEGRLHIGIIGFQDKAYFIGGADFNKKNYRSRIDIFDELSIMTKTNNIEVMSFDVFPNPATDNLSISTEMTNEFLNGRYSIISAFGTAVLEGVFQNNIDIKDLPSGYFQLVFYNEDKNHIWTTSFAKM